MINIKYFYLFFALNSINVAIAIEAVQSYVAENITDRIRFRYGYCNNWNDALTVGRRLDFHGRYLVDGVYRHLGSLPATYQAGSFDNFPSVEFKNGEINDAVTRTMMDLVFSAFTTPFNSPTVPKGIIHMFAESFANRFSKPSNYKINWNHENVIGTVSCSTFEIFDDKTLSHERLLFSVNSIRFDLDVENIEYLYLFKSKRINITNFSGDFGLLLF